MATIDLPDWDKLTNVQREWFLRGFAASGEGWNGEYMNLNYTEEEIYNEYRKRGHSPYTIV